MCNLGAAQQIAESMGKFYVPLFVPGTWNLPTHPYVLLATMVAMNIFKCAIEHVQI